MTTPAAAQPARSATRFAKRSPAAALFILVVLAAALAWGVAVAGGPAERAEESRGIDAALYRSVVARVHAGEGYYDVAGSELRGRGFATRPVWNWRLPTLAWITALLLRPELARGLLAISALVALLLWIAHLRDERGVAAALVGGALLGSALLLCASASGFLFHELWAGVWIALSLGAHARGHWRTSLAVGLAALFVRELALPYAGIMLLAAWTEGRRREMRGWGLGLLAFGVALGAHALVVASRLGDAEPLGGGWLQLGGWSFVLATARWNALLFPAPPWLVALLLPLGLLGLAGWRGGVGARAAGTVGAYVAAYLVVGRPDNAYWGLLYAPLAPLGLLFAPAALRDLGRAASRRRA